MDKLHYRVDLSHQNADNFVGMQRTPYTYWNGTTVLLRCDVPSQR